MVVRLLSLPLRIAVLGLVIAVLPAAAQDKPRESTGLVPLTQMSVTARYKGEDGGLYGKCENTPPETLRRVADAELAKIVTLNAEGLPAANGIIGFVSISMSNATQEFEVFKQRADADRRKSPRVTIVDWRKAARRWPNG